MLRRFTARTFESLSRTRKTTSGKPSAQIGFLSFSRHMPVAARALLALWLSPTIFTAFASITLLGTPVPAGSQGVTEPTVVLDFAVPQGVDPGLGRKAADALAVELQRSGEYDVIPRQRVEQALKETPALHAPFDQPTQARLAQAVGARSLFSGKILGAAVNERKSARVNIEVRQLDVVTGDYINGAVVSELTSDALMQVDSELLIDQAVNKGAASATRIMKQTRLPVGTVMNVSKDLVVINLGARSGVRAGQHYSLMRDIFDKGRNVVERVKVGELVITRTEAEQSDARQLLGQTGVRTGDKVREIYQPAVYPVAAVNTGAPVTTLPPTITKSPGIVKKAGSGISGVLGLAAAVALLGFLGGASGNRADSSPPTNVIATPIIGSGGAPAVTVNYQAGVPGILAGDNVVGYLIYRGTDSNFAATSDNLQDFVQNDVRNYSDNSTVFAKRTIEIASGGNASGFQLTASTSFNFEAEEDFINEEIVSDFSISEVIVRTPPVPGQQYFYKIRRITLVNLGPSATGSSTGGGGGIGRAVPRQTLNPGGTGGSGRRLAISEPSEASGGATAIPRPVVISTSSNLDNLTVTISAVASYPFFTTDLDGDGSDDEDPGFIIAGIFGFTQVDEFEVQVSISPQFPANNRFSQNFPPPPNPGQASTLVFNLGDIIVPNFEPGDSSVFVRVGARNTSDNPGATIFSPAFQVINPTGNNSRGVIRSGSNRNVIGLGIPVGSSGGRDPGRVPGRIRR